MTAVVSPADEVNARISAFMRRRLGRPLWPEEREQYEQLLTEWAEAEREQTADAPRACP